MKLLLKDYAKKAKVSVTILGLRIKQKKIIAILGVNKRNRPCFYIDTDRYPVKDNGRGKAGRPKNS